NHSPWLRGFQTPATRAEAWGEWRRGLAVRLADRRVPLAAGAAAAAILAVNLLPSGLLNLDRTAQPVVTSTSSDPLVRGIADALSAATWPSVTRPSIDDVAQEGMPVEDTLN